MVPPRVAVYAWQSPRDASEKVAELPRVLWNRLTRRQQREHPGVAAQGLGGLQEIQPLRSFRMGSACTAGLRPERRSVRVGVKTFHLFGKTASFTRQGGTLCSSIGRRGKHRRECNTPLVHGSIDPDPHVCTTTIKTPGSLFIDIESDIERGVSAPRSTFRGQNDERRTGSKSSGA